MKQSLKDIVVLCDLDTLLLDEQGNLPQVTRDVLQLFSSRGGRMTVFSQRTPRAARTLLGGVRLSAPALLCGGTVLYNLSSGENIVLGSLSELGQAFLSSLPVGSGIGIALQMKDGSTRVLRMSRTLQQHLKNEWTPYVLAKAEGTPIDDVLRILIYKDSRYIQTLEFFEKALEESLAPVEVSHLDDDLVVLSPRSLSGREMLHSLSQVSRTAPYELAVVAGSVPMLELVRLAGRSAASADAPAELRVAARETMLTNSGAGAAAEYLYRLVRSTEE